MKTLAARDLRKVVRREFESLRSFMGPENVFCFDSEFAASDFPVKTIRKAVTSNKPSFETFLNVDFIAIPPNCCYVL